MERTTGFPWSSFAPPFPGRGQVAPPPTPKNLRSIR